MKTTKLLSLTSLVLQIFAVLLVTKGIFLVRETILDTTGANPLDGSETWYKQKAKVILFVIDSLRFNFIYYNKTLEGHETSVSQNKFVKLHDLAEKNPENFVLLKLFADAPTITLQKVQTMMTGYVPPYAEIIDFIIRKPVTKDNIMTKLEKANKKSYQLGDALWPFLFPTQFTETYPCEALVVTDFDSVDRKIEQNIFPVIEKNDFDFIVAHGIGVDHYGHMGLMESPGFGEKLTEFDNLVTQIIDAMDDNTILMVAGDHGMYKEGGHGGLTDLEVYTGLAAYTKKGFRKYKEQGIEDIMKSYKDSTTVVNQADLASTFASMLGVSIPYTNVGNIISDLYPNDETLNSNEFTAQLVRDNYINLLQIEEYVNTVQERTHKFPIEAFSALTITINEAKANYKEFQADSIQTSPNLEALKIQGVKLISKLQAVSKQVYVMTKSCNSNGYFFIIFGALLAVASLVLALLMVKHLNLCINSEEILFTWNDQIQIRSLMKSASAEIKNNRILQLMGTLILVVTIRFQLGVLEVISLIVLSVVLIAMYKLIQINAELSGKHSQYTIMDLKEVVTIHSFLKSRLSIESLLDKFIVVLIAVSQLYIRSSVFITRDEERPTQILLLAIFALLTLKIFSSKNQEKSLLNKLWLFEKLALAGLIVGLCRHFNFLNEEIYGDSEPFFSSPVVKTFIPIAIFGQRMFVKIGHFKQKGNEKPWIRGFLMAPLILVNVNYILPVFLKDYYLPCKIVIPLFIYGLLLVAFAISLRGHLKQSPSNENKDNKDNFVVSCQTISLIFIFVLVGNGSIGAFVLTYLTLQLVTAFFIKTDPESMSYPFIVMMICSYGYFCTGHNNLLHRLQFPQAYIGFYKFNVVTSGLLLTTNTYSCMFTAFIFMINMGRYVYENRRAKIYVEVKETNYEFHEAKAKTYKSITWLRSNFVFAAVFALRFIINTGCCMKYYNGEELIEVYSPKFILDSTAYAIGITCMTLFSQ